MQQPDIPTPQQVQARQDAVAKFIGTLKEASAVFSDVGVAGGGQLSADLAARVRVALQNVTDGVSAVTKALDLEPAPDVLPEPARVTYALVKAAESGEWGVRFACQGSCPKYLGDGAGGGMMKGETFKDHHQKPRGCRPPGVDSSNFQVCIYPGCAPAKGRHALFTAQGLEKHLKSGHPGGIGGMVEFLLDPDRVKPEGTLAVLGEDLCGRMDDPWMVKTHKEGSKRSLFADHSDVHFVSAHVEHDGRGGVRTKRGYTLRRGETGEAAAAAAAAAISNAGTSDGVEREGLVRQQQQQQQRQGPPNTFGLRMGSSPNASASSGRAQVQRGPGAGTFSSSPPPARRPAGKPGKNGSPPSTASKRKQGEPEPKSPHKWGTSFTGGKGRGTVNHGGAESESDEDFGSSSMVGHRRK